MKVKKVLWSRRGKERKVMEVCAGEGRRGGKERMEKEVWERKGK